MRYRTNPWPSFADLFSATLIVTFAGMVMMTAAYRQDMQTYKGQAENANRRASEGAAVVTAVRQARVEADKVVEKVKQALEGDSSMKSITRRCGDDTCLDLYMQFPTNGWDIENEGELTALHRVCDRIQRAINELPPEQRKDIEIVIEGHTDNTQPQMADPREQYRYNWDLSAKRATSVAYEFNQMGLKPPAYRIVTIGYADSMPLCYEDTQPCRDRNRRTTLILRGDTREIEKRLAQQPGAAPPATDASR
jgi:outer membrane protein OmpA-like peptidoglycan-associated protein